MLLCCSCGSPIPFYERVNPVESPQRICRKHSGMIQYLSVFVDHGKESVHHIRDIPEMWREVIPDIDR